MRRSMGLRGRDSNDSFFIRMRERARGSRRGLLELLIERARERSFTQAQCMALTDAHDEVQRQLGKAASREAKEMLLEEFDGRVKEISYGRDS
jgi:hypothetical protein